MKSKRKVLLIIFIILIVCVYLRNDGIYVLSNINNSDLDWVNKYATKDFKFSDNTIVKKIEFTDEIKNIPFISHSNGLRAELYVPNEEINEIFPEKLRNYVEKNLKGAIPQHDYKGEIQFTAHNGFTVTKWFDKMPKYTTYVVMQPEDKYTLVYVYTGLLGWNTCKYNFKFFLKQLKITSSYTYDGDNLRQTKTVNGVQTQHILDGADVIADISGESIKTFVRGAELEFLKTSDGATQGYMTSYPRGDVRYLISQDGTVNDYTYTTYGEKVGTNDNTVNPFGYCGEYFDAETDLVYLRNRYYDPQMHRFITEDPAKDGVNWYAYCNGNPVMFTDPWGYTAGQLNNQNGYGGIYNTYDYVNDKYGKGWSSKNWGTLEPNISRFLMNDLDENANNCTLTAITRVFAYYRDNQNMSKIPDNGTLYEDIKNIAEKYGYTAKTGTSPTKINNIINDIFKKYDYSGKGSSIYVWSFNTVKKEIDAGRPLIFNIAFGYYANHTVTVVGYSEFTRTKGMIKETKKFIKVYDGWTNNDSYIDYDLLNFGSFSVAKP